jgi:hypothetical protein
MKTPSRFSLALLLVLQCGLNLFGQTFVGTNSPGQGTNFTFTLGASATNLSLVVSNTGSAYSCLLLKKGGVPASDTDFDFISRLDGRTNRIDIEPPQFTPTNYGLRVLTPSGSAAHSFHVALSTNRTDLRSGAYPLLKPVVFSSSTVLSKNPSGSWHYYQVDVPTNLPGWKIVLFSTNSGTSNPDLYVRKNDLPFTWAYDKAAMGRQADTLVYTDTEATAGTYFIGVYLSGSAATNATYTLGTELGFVSDLGWDPGTTHEGTVVYTNTSTIGGNCYFRILPQNTSVGAWRLALKVNSGEADLYLRQSSSFDPNSDYYPVRSTRIGSDGLVLHSSQFGAGQVWYLCVSNSPGAQWTMVSGEAYVMDLGDLAPYYSEGSSASVPMGPEGMRFFKTTMTVDTTAWRLWLKGTNADILVKKSAVPHPLNGSTYDLKQAMQMLVVPNYLVGGDQYFVGVSGAPGDTVNLDSRRQQIIDVPFVSTNPILISNAFGYVTYRISVPVDQIAWLTAVTPTLGNANLCVRSNMVPNEWNNNAFSEVAGTTTDSISLVPPTLSDGTFFVTVYGLANYTCTFISGNPVVTDVAYVSTTLNDDPARVGWRYYRVTDIASQLGTLGWDLFLQSQPDGTELAIRRNAVPGRWNYRSDNGTYVYSQGSVDYSGPQGFLQRPGHQADIWYIGAYNPDTALGGFVLNLRELTGPLVAFDGTVSNVVNQPYDKFQYYRIDVPTNALGWDLRLTNVTSGDPRLVVRRDQLPDSLNTHGHPSGYWYPYLDTQWRSGYQWGPYTDWTDYYYDASGTVVVGRTFACGRGNPLEPGSYYVGVINPSGTTPMSYTLVSRGIGTGLSIPVTPLAFAGGTATLTNLPVREAAYFSVTVPTNTHNWKLSLSTNSGDASFYVEKSFLPNIEASTSSPIWPYGGRQVQKPGEEQFILFAENNQTNLQMGTYYIAVVGEGQNPHPSASQAGTGASSVTLTSVGVSTPVNLGTLGADLVSPGLLKGGETRIYQFTVPSNILAMEVWLESRTGNPRITLRPDTLDSSHPWEGYGHSEGSSYYWYSDNLINVANPTNGIYNLCVQACGSGSDYPDATYTVRVHALTATPVTFDGGSTVVSGGHLAGTWRYYSVTVPTNAMGWDIRIDSPQGGDPRLVVCRDLAPDGLGTHGPNGWGWYYTYTYTNWPTAYQWAAGNDWTGFYADASGTNRYGQILAMGMGNPLSPGTYIVGIINSDTYNTNDMRYTLVSRGIGNGMTIPVRTLSFTNGLATITNLAPRETAYFSVTVPTNVIGWQIRLGTNNGEGVLAVQKNYLPNINASGTSPVYLYGGRLIEKAGHEQYLLLPENGRTNIPAGTYFVAACSEGMNPRDYWHIGTNSATLTLQSLGSPFITSLGNLSPGTDLVLTNTLEGGAIKVYQFNVMPGTLSAEVRLENRIADPTMSLRPDGLIPSTTQSYGRDGGQSYTWQDDALILMANPTNGIHTLAVHADYTGPGGSAFAVFSNATYTVRVHAVGAIPIAFDGGNIPVTDQAADSWRYFLVTNVSAGALGWDVRLTNITSGDPRLVIRRELLPDSIYTHGQQAGWGWYYPETSTLWPTGYQWGATYDWTGHYYDADGTNQYGHVLQMGVGNPLETGNYYIGVYTGGSWGYGSNPMNYTLVTRGIGGGCTLPVTPLAFNGGSATNSFLRLREAAYYYVDVPTNTPSWKIRLGVGAGDSLLIVQKDHLPNVNAGTYYSATQVGGGYMMRKVGNEHFVLMPQSGQTNIPAGRYYLLAASQGLFPESTGYSRAGTNGSSFFIQSQGVLPINNLGAIPLAGISSTNSIEGGELRAFQFSQPTNRMGLVARLDNRAGNPWMSLRKSTPLVYPQFPYGYNYGEYANWSADRIITIGEAPVTNYTLIVQGGQSGAVYPDADFVLRLEQATIHPLAFDPLLEGCDSGHLELQICTNAIQCGLLADNERAFYRVQVPSVLPDGTPVIGWSLTLSNGYGQASVRVRKDLLPSDDANYSGQTTFVTGQAIIVPPVLTPGTWYVEVKGSTPTAFCISSRAIRLQRPPWIMPGYGESITTTGLVAGPYFADTGVDTNGVALPGDGGTDLEQGFFHHYAITVPTNNGGILRTMLEAISGNPDLYIRPQYLPTLTHRADAQNGSIFERSLTGYTTEYGNWVPFNGRYESILTNGTYYLAVKASGGSNCRYRLKISTGAVTNFATLVSAVTNQTMAAGDWRYYRYTVPTNAPVDWNVTFWQHVGDVVLYVRDVTPPGYGSTTYDIHDWYSDQKNHGPYSYSGYDSPGTTNFTVPAIRPGHVYYLGFHAVSDATFSLATSTNGPRIDVTNLIAFYGGYVTNVLSVGSVARYRIDVPSDARRWKHVAVGEYGGVRFYLDQGSIPTVTYNDHWYCYGSGSLSQSLANPYSWPWQTNQMYYLVVTNTSVTVQGYSFRMDGRNCANDDEDADTLPDCWELTYWPSIYWYGPLDDPDGDGVKNIDEYLNGTNPTFPDPFYLTDFATLPDGNMRFLFVGGTNGSYRVVASPTLLPGSWLTITSFVNSTGTRIINDYNATNYPVRFYQGVTP